MTQHLTPMSNPNYVVEVEDQEDAKIQEDFEKSRDNIATIITHGSAAIEEMAALAKASQLPEYYEVLAKLFKEVGDSSQKLLNAHEQLEKIINKKQSKKTGDGKESILLTTAAIANALKIEKGKTDD
jgi:hypothetical protein